MSEWWAFTCDVCWLLFSDVQFAAAKFTAALMKFVENDKEQMVNIVLFSFTVTFVVIYSVSGKKRDQNVFCYIFYKTRAILMKFGKQFPE